MTLLTEIVLTIIFVLLGIVFILVGIAIIVQAPLVDMIEPKLPGKQEKGYPFDENLHSKYDPDDFNEPHMEDHIKNILK